jgi:uncharacterized caspase-like protein
MGAAAAYFAGFTDVQKIKGFFVAEKLADSPVTPSVPSQPTSIGTEKRVALVIGNVHYDNLGELPNDKNDADAMTQTLTNLGFTVNKVLDLNAKQMDDEIEKFIKQLQQDSIGLIYYSGHGLELAGNQYLVPINASATNIERTIVRENVSVPNIVEQLADKAALSILILDACRNNPITKALKGKGLSNAKSGVAEVKPAHRTLIASATSSGDTALPNCGENSCYTKQLLSYLKTQPQIEARILLGKVGEAVRDETKNDQEPWVTSSYGEDFYFDPLLHTRPDDDIEAKAEAVRKLEEKAAELKAETERQEALVKKQEELAKKAEELRLEAEKNKAEDGWKTINRYQVKDDLVKDTKTSLMWMRCSLGQDWNGKTCKGKATEYTWDDAMKAPNNFRFMDYSDWRVPTIEELKTLVYCDNGEEQTWNMNVSEYSRCDIKDYKKPTIMNNVFPNTPSDFFWSSSPDANSETKATISSGINVWAAAFHDGSATLWDTNSPSAVRLVRGSSFNLSKFKVKINHPLNVAKLEHSLPKLHKVAHQKIGKTKDSHNVYSMLH